MYIQFTTILGVIILTLHKIYYTRSLLSIYLSCQSRTPCTFVHKMSWCYGIWHYVRISNICHTILVQRISVFEPFAMRDTVQHFCEKHLDKIKAYMQKVFVKLPLPVRCGIEGESASVLMCLQLAAYTFYQSYIAVVSYCIISSWKLWNQTLKFIFLCERKNLAKGNKID